MRPIEENPVNDRTSFRNRLLDLERWLESHMDETKKSMQKEIDAVRSRIKALESDILGVNAVDRTPFQSYVQEHLLHMGMRLTSISDELSRSFHSRAIRDYSRQLLGDLVDELAFVERIHGGEKQESEATQE